MAQIILSSIILCLTLLSSITWGFGQNGLATNNGVQTKTNVNYSRILNFWKEHKKEFVLNGKHKEVVLVMGNTGAGKTTLVSALIGRRLKVTRPQGYLIIEDDEGRIGKGVSSKTLVPEVMVDNERNVTYIDCSGFRDNRDIEYEISSLYFQNILMDQINKIKLILVISYESMKINGNKNDFDDLFEHVGEFIKQISKFHDAIALVVTKVENSYDVSEDGVSSVLSLDNQPILNVITNYLRSKKDAYHRRTENVEKYRAFENLIDVLLQKQNNNYKRIGIFRQPTRVGLLEKNAGMKDAIKNIAKMTEENLRYVGKQKDDFGFALSKSSRDTVNDIVSDIFRNALSKSLQKFGNETIMHYLQMEKQYSDIKILNKLISEAYDFILRVKRVNKPERLFEEFLNVANTLNISVSLTNLDIISDDIKALRFFTTVLNKNEDEHMMLLIKTTQNILDSIESIKNFYEFLNHLHDNLASYNSQILKDNNHINNILTSCANPSNKVLQDIRDLGYIANQVGSYSMYQRIKTLKLDKYRMNHLIAIFNAFKRGLEFSCESTTTPMIVKGYNVKISDVVNIYCWQQARNIQIFALNKVFIDKTINKVGIEAQLSIFSPTWEVIGEPMIILDGKEGKSHKSTSANAAFSHSEDGAIGLPGHSGGPAGSFFGVGEQFINAGQLKIHANGGKGGPGQHGGNGMNGVAGEELPELFFSTNQAPEDVKKYFDEHQYRNEMHQLQSLAEPGDEGPPPTTTSKYDVEVWGRPAKKPTNGGDGGVGGKGGYPGTILIKSLGQSAFIQTSMNQGPPGTDGQGGRAGKGTQEARKVKFRYNYGYVFLYLGYKASFYQIQWSPAVKVPAGKDGQSGRNTNRQDNPVPPTVKNFYPAVNAFKSFVRLNLFENLKESELRTFIDKLENDYQIKALYNTLASVEEFKGLEQQFLELRNKINFTPFYDSLLARIEEYAKSEKIMENKKVLSYIYTAALTKLITLNKNRKGQTVVDLPKYLDTIQKSVREINRAYHGQVVQQYQTDYKKTLNKKIQEADNFIQNVIEPEIDKLWDESENQIRAIVNEINENRNSTRNSLEALEMERSRINSLMLLRATLSPLKLATTFLSMAGPVGAGVGVAVTTATTLAEGVLLDTTSHLGENKIYSLDPNLKTISRVTEVFNNKHSLAKEKLNAAMEKLDKYEKELSVSEKVKKNGIKKLKTDLQEAVQRRTNGFSATIQKVKDIEDITHRMASFITAEKDVVEKKKEEEKKVTDLTKEKKYENRLRLLNDAQSVLNGVEVIYSLTRRLTNDAGALKKVETQISENVKQLEALEKMENQVYSIILPDFRQIGETIDTARSSMNGSSHATLDLTKWNVRTTLKDLKSQMQKFTKKMSFELQSNLQRFMEKIDEGFSILIDIYDRIDSYSDSVKQAEYIAHIESSSMNNVQVADGELSKAVNDLKLIIHSNILTERYKIALHAFKQHYFPFAADFLQQFELPTGMQLRDTETLRSNIINKITEMKNYINERTATIGEYSKYIHNSKVFDSTTIGSEPFYVWKHDTIKDEVKKLLNGSEVVIRADVSKGPFYNAIKYNDIGINFKFNDRAMQSRFTSLLRNFKLTMTMIGNNYYRCGERYYFISFDDDITVSYTLNHDGRKNWIDPNEIYTLIHNSHSFLSPYGMWSIKLQSVNRAVSFDALEVFANEKIDLELVGQGYYIEQDDYFNFNVCNEYLDRIYEVENIVRALF